MTTADISFTVLTGFVIGIFGLTFYTLCLFQGEYARK
jgi:hypothetical protein